MRELDGRISVSTWYQGAECAMSFTFDDGTKDHSLYVKPILEARKFKGTFFAVTGWLDSGQGNAGTWAMLQELDGLGHEIASHCVTHPALPQLPEGLDTTPGTARYELAHAKAEIEARLKKPVISLAYPFTARSEAVDALAGSYYLANRNGGLDADHPVWNPSHSPQWMNLTSFTPRFPAVRNSPKDDLPVLERTKSALESAIPQRGWAILMTHAVVPFAQLATYGGWETQSTEWFTDLCDWLQVKRNSGAMWIDTMGNVTRYIRERDAARLELSEATEKEIRFSLVDGLDRRIFNQPLSVAVQIPANWKRVHVDQPSQRPQTISLKRKSARTLWLQMVPGSGTVHIRRL